MSKQMTPGQREAWEIRRQRACLGLCILCGSPAEPYATCQDCRERAAEKRTRKRLKAGKPAPERVPMDDPRRGIRRPRVFTAAVLGKRGGWSSEEDAELCRLLDKAVPIETLIRKFSCSEKAIARRANKLGRKEFNPKDFSTPYALARMKKW